MKKKRAKRQKKRAKGQKKEPKGTKSDRKEPHKDTSGSSSPIPSQKGTLRNKVAHTKRNNKVELNSNV